MATADLYLVTQTLTRLLDLNVRALLFRQGLATTLSVTAMPPERVGAQQNTLNLHLYHAMEDAYYRNQPPPGRGGPPVARQPLSLSLFYILTAHHEINDNFDAEIQQRNFGLALKTLHDHSQIDDDLAISPDAGPPQTVMVAGLQGGDNRIEISPRPLTPEEAITFWSAEQSATTRLSAYYEVRTVFIEPELPTGTFGRVFDLGLFVFPMTAPVIQRVSALASFTPPPASGLGPQLIETVPARATLDPASSPEVNRVRVAGSALTGDGLPGSARFVLRTAAWRDLVPPLRSAAIDPALNPAWAVTMTESEGQFDLQGSLMVDTGGGPFPVEVTPGIYALSVQATRRAITPGGTVRTSTTESNQVAFSVGARIVQITPPNPAGRMVVQLVNVFDMTAAGLDVQLAIGGELYDETAAFSGVAAQDRGLFQRQAGQIEFHPLFDPTLAGIHPLRLTINGAESQPFWIETP